MILKRNITDSLQNIKAFRFYNGEVLLPISEFNALKMRDYSICL